uniref:Uncharacterized protein n=1 Tax=Sipha flava TaxID=143950 RepID=A0A2S2R8M8_9HEMI
MYKSFGSPHAADCFSYSLGPWLISSYYCLCAAAVDRGSWDLFSSAKLVKTSAYTRKYNVFYLQGRRTCTHYVRTYRDVIGTLIVRGKIIQSLDLNNIHITCRKNRLPEHRDRERVQKYYVRFECGCERFGG